MEVDVKVEFISVTSFEMSYFVASYMNQNKNINKLSRVRCRDWMSSLEVNRICYVIDTSLL